MLVNKSKLRRTTFEIQKKARDVKNISTREFERNLFQIQHEFIHLFKEPVLAKDHKFLRKISIAIKQVHYFSKTAPLHREVQWKAKSIEAFFETAISKPFVAPSSLVHAALSFSEQEPQYSDISEILEKMATYASQFSHQIFRLLGSRT